MSKAKIKGLVVMAGVGLVAGFVAIWLSNNNDTIKGLLR